MIQTEGLTKHYDKLVAVEDLNIHVQPGEIYGFLGPNGAGKTTTIMMLLGIERPTKGKVKLFGKDMAQDYFEIKRRIGVLSEFQYLYEDMTGYEYLRFFCNLYQVKHPDQRIKACLERVNLYHRKDELLGGYSKGMKQKLGLARILLHDPEVLILDEPVSSLDPYGVREVRDIMLEENRRGKTVFISSHILSEIERTCHRVGIIHKGRLIAEDTMDAIKRRAQEEGELIVELEETKDELVRALAQIPGITDVHVQERAVHLKTGAGDFRAVVSRTIAAHGGVVLSMRAKEISLEDAFMTITEKNISLLAKDGEAA